MNIEAPQSQAMRGKGDAGTTIVDCDVHPVVAGGFTPLYPFMPKAWAERFKLKLARVPNILPLTFRFEHPSGSAARHDAATPSGGQRAPILSTCARICSTRTASRLRC